MAANPGDDAGKGGEGRSIQLPEVVVSGSGDHHRVSRTCDQDIAEMQQKTQAATAKSDPRARNKDITRAYRELADKCPDNRWIKLGSIVSAQAGCAMDQLGGFSAQTAGRFYVNPGKATNALGAVNKDIFNGIYPYAAFACKYGIDRLLECYGDKLPPDLRTAFEDLKQGKKKEAALGIAQYEQGSVVNNAYSQNAGVFQNIEQGRESYKYWFGSDPGSIPLSYECGATPTIPFNGNINNLSDRIGYYNTLYNA